MIVEVPVFMKKILVIDDMPTMLEHAVKTAGERYNVITAGSGAEGVQKVFSERPDVILLDMYMKDRESFDLMKELKADIETRDIPIIITAADVSIVAMARGYSFGAADFMKKPFVEEIMYRKIDMQLQLVETHWTYKE